MKTKLETELDALYTKHAEERAELERKAKIEARLPQTAVPVNFIYAPRHSEPHISYEVPDLAGVFELVNVYAPLLVPYRDARANGCRTLQPVALMEGDYRKAAANSADWTGPIFRYHAYAETSPSASFEFWAKVRGLGIVQVSIKEQRSGFGGGDAFGFWASCERNPVTEKPKPGSWRAPQGISADEVTTWGTGDPCSAQWSFRWHTLIGFRAALGPIIEQRAARAKENRERQKAEYKSRRNPAEIAGRCRFVLEVLNRPTVRALLLVPRERAHGWTLKKLREVGYSAIQKAAHRAAPEVFEVGIHDFANTVYFLSKDTDGYDHAEDYRDDLRAVFDEMAKGAR